MPVKTNLNISPYFEDFDKADNFYKMLFKPGFQVKAREKGYKSYIIPDVILGHEKMLIVK